ncbi:RCC1 domain-containing protein [Planctomycetota bacterium]
MKADGTVVSWGEGNVGRARVPGGPAPVVAVAGAGYGRAVVVRADGTIVGWPKGSKPFRDDVTGVAAVALGDNFTLALKKDGRLEVIGGSINGTPETGRFVAIAAGGSHALALRDDGTVVAWGDTSQGACGLGDGTRVPVGMLGSRHLLHILMEDGRGTSLGTAVPSDLGPVVGIAAARGGRFALKADGAVVNMATPAAPTGHTDVVAIAAGGYHTLMLKANGEVVALGSNPYGQCRVPDEAKTNVVAIAAGLHHSLALRANRTVVAWGRPIEVAPRVMGRRGGRRGSRMGGRFAPRVADVVAIAAGDNHSLALKVNGEVVAWGSNSHGQCTVPGELKGVVAIAAGRERSLALKADRKVAAWGRNDRGECDFAAAQTGVLAMAVSPFDFSPRDTFLVSQTTPSIENTKPLRFVRGEVPPGVRHRSRALCAHVVSEFDRDLKDRLNELTGAKALLESVIALGLPESLEQDDVLRGLLYGSESLIDRDGACALYEAELNRLNTTWRARPPTLKETSKARLKLFRERLGQRLDALEKSGTPEIPRMVSHTLLQLRLLRAAH